MAKAKNLANTAPELSVIVPIFNEEESIKPLCERLLSVLDEMGKAFEVIFVNDGSSDNSMPLLREAASGRDELKIVNFRRNYGQKTVAGGEY